MLKGKEMNQPNISRVIEGFLLHQGASGRSPNTLRNYRQELLRFLEFIGDKQIDEVSSREIENFFLYLKNDFMITHRGTTPITPRKLTSKTISNCHGTLAVFWKWTNKEFGINNPFTLPPIRFHMKPILPLKGEEIERLLDNCKMVEKGFLNQKRYSAQRNTSKRDKAIILTLLDSGVRVSEMCSANIKDLELEIGRLFVTGKGNKSRFVYLGKICRRAIWGYLAERYPDHSPNVDEPLFMDRYNLSRLTRQGVLELLKSIANRAKVENVHPHRFRHTFAIEFLRNGGNVFELQQLLGHSDLETARRYVQLAQTDLETSFKKASPVDRWQLKP